MGFKLKASDEANRDRDKLPPNLRADLDRMLDDLANNPGVPGTKGSDQLVGFSIDGSRFEVEVFYRWFEDELFVSSVDIYAY